MKDNRIFKACEVDCNKIGWFVDLLPENIINIVNPDCYWYFKTKKECKEFIRLFENGYSGESAYHIVTKEK